MEEVVDLFMAKAMVYHQINVIRELIQLQIIEMLQEDLGVLEAVLLCTP